MVISEDHWPRDKKEEVLYENILYFLPRTRSPFFFLFLTYWLTYTEYKTHVLIASDMVMKVREFTFYWGDINMIQFDKYYDRDKHKVTWQEGHGKPNLAWLGGSQGGYLGKGSWALKTRRALIPCRGARDRGQLFQIEIASRAKARGHNTIRGFIWMQHMGFVFPEGGR